MSKAVIQVDTRQVEALFDRLEPKQLRSATRSAFNRAGRVMVNAAKAEYRSMFPGSVYYKDIHMKAYRSGKGVMVDLYYLKNHAKGDPLYKSYVLRILEVGNYKTARRSRGNSKNGSRADRGKIRAYHFFQQGTESVIQQVNSQFTANLEQAMKKQIEKAS